MRKSSKQRDIILALVKSSHHHYTPNEIFQELNDKGEKISLATVYRNLNVLFEMGLIDRIILPDEKVVYDQNTGHHYHLYCSRCNQIFDLPVDYLIKLDEVIKEKSGLTIESHDLIANGICPTCANK